MSLLLLELQICWAVEIYHRWMGWCTTVRAEAAAEVAEEEEEEVVVEDLRSSAPRG